ncbi:putative secreted protein [Anaerosolibacter carboniphilus]|uniref:Putative secreted protein n=1 Tax=Anaerosolibacter carboniphilus TaxID=1417629 RepID=A0A841L0C8_9FIRM|nr:CD3072 family TudS-related putative desulfidase [Anaerosolibacter carboniphilus]MBB6218028.1 putative secreted protein [Anaerosolibacter carboniphilus]
MLRKKKIILATHCILNQNAVIRDWERAEGAFNSIVRILLDYNVGIIQLPCPEFTYLGEGRPPKTKEEYDKESYHLHCKQLSIPIVKELGEYIKKDYHILGLIGIQGSPSCDILGKRGIFIEELLELLQRENIDLKAFEIPESYIEGQSDQVVDDFKQFINKAY